jgi:sulfatase maturation enzyme AslB (radical SAM superfamily)
MDKRIFKNYVDDEIIVSYGEAKSVPTENKIKMAGILDREFNFNLLGKPEYEHSQFPKFLKDLESQVPENFCLYPFIHLQIDPDGRARPCCKYKVGDSDWQQDVPKLPDVTIEDLWNQPELQKLRGQFLRNERPSGCHACWDEEKAGMMSMRKMYDNGGKLHPNSTFFHHIPRQSPKSLDLKLSNLCNLKCRICTPFLSSQWIKEHKDLKISDPNIIKMYTENSREKFSADPSNAEILKKWAKNIDHLEFYGGEPLMQQEHDIILNIINDFGNPDITNIWYNSNATICDEKFFLLWKNFREVTISLSVDDIGPRFEYQRMNAKWDEVVSNIDKFKLLTKKYNVNLFFRIYITVGIHNVYYLDEILEYVKNNFKLPVVFNLVHYPNHYSLVNFPNFVKSQIENKLRSIDTTDVEFVDWSPSIDNIIKYMYDREYDPLELEKFFKFTQQHDVYRNQSFKETFNEVYELLKLYDDNDILK